MLGFLFVFFFSDLRLQKKTRLALSSMIQAIKKVKDSIILIFSPTKLSELVNYK